MISLREIQYVAAVANEKSFSVAAKKLYVSQPALSQAIKRLEKKLDFKLFDRENGFVTPTTAGKAFLDGGASLMYMSRQFEDRMGSLTNLESTKLRIGISLFYGQYHLPNFLPRFTSQYPGVKVEMVEEQSAQLEELAFSDEVDFSMVPLPLNNKKLEYQVLHQEHILFAAPKSFPFLPNFSYPEAPELPSINLSLAREEPFIFLKNMRFTEMGLQICRNAGFNPNIRFETRSWSTVLAFIEHGLGVGLLSDALVYQSGGTHNINFYRILDQDARRPYAAVYKSYDKLSAIARSFIRIAKNVFNEYPY